MTQLLLKNGTNVILPSIVGPEFKAEWMPEGFTNAEHHALLDSISSSSLKMILDSPYTYLETIKRRQNGLPMKKTRAMKFGDISHLIVLEPSEFRRRMVLSPKFDRRTTRGKEDAQLFELDQAPDAIIFPSSEEGENEYDKYVGVVSAIANHEKARDIFKEGVAERTGIFREEKTGIKTRFRPDWMSTIIEGGLFIDFKTAASSEYFDFQKQLEKLAYHIQIYLYREGYKAINGAYPKACAWVVVCSSFPFEVSIFTVDEAMLTYAEQWYRYSMDLLAICIEKKQFPQRQTQAECMVPSSYAMAKQVPNLEDIKWG